MVPVLASLVALALGPALLAASRGQRWVLGGVDGFVVVSIGGIVFLHMLPHAYLVGGPSMLLIAAVGLFGPTLLERVVGPRLPAATRWMLPAALLGLALHAMLDGVVLVEAHDGHGHEEATGDSLMALGVVLHRIPEGLAIWWVFRRQHGLRAALLALAVIAAATALGFGLAEHLERFLGPLHGIQALVAGSLLHVLLHRSHDLLATSPAPAPDLARAAFDARQAHSPTTPDEPLPTAGHAHAPIDHAGHAHTDRASSHGTVDHASAAGFLPPPGADTTGPLVRAEHLPAALGALLAVAMLWGVALAHPASHRIADELAMGTTFSLLALRLAPALLASYVAVAVLHVAWRRGLDTWLYRHPPSPFALIAFACSLVLIGVAPAVAYLLGEHSLCIVIGLFQPRQDRDRLLREAPEAPPLSVQARLEDGLHGTLFVIDHTLPWLLFGLGLAAFAESSLAPDALAVSRFVAVPLAALIGWPWVLSPVGLTPLLAVLVHKGLPPGAALAVLLTGAVRQRAADRRLTRTPWTAVPATLLFATAAGFLPPSWLGPTHALALHDHALIPAGPVAIASLVVLTLLAFLSLVRRGPRTWVEHITGDSHGH